jgi:hypothetical protein
LKKTQNVKLEVKIGVGVIYMKKQYKHLLLLVMVILLLTGCFSESINKRISKSLGIEIPKNIKIEYEDTHGGFHGDGETVVVVEFNNSIGEDIKSKISNNEDWNSLPLSENLDLIMYGGQKEGIDYAYNLAEALDMPPIENGYWFFNNRHSNSISPKEDSNLFNQYSFNFTIAVYDIDTQTLYYLEFDT